jgi:hypothetical protein
MLVSLVPRSILVVSLASSIVFAAGCQPRPAVPRARELVPDRWIWGVTVDDVIPLVDTVAALGGLAPTRLTARVVFDEGQPPAYYARPVSAIHGVSDVMGEILDSQFVKNVSVGGYVDRATAYLDALGNDVDIWEVGNEVNGDWLGSSDDVVAKIAGAYRAATARRRATALTLYYNAGCVSDPAHEMFAWAEAHVPAEMRDGLGYVFVSYYEDDCNGLQPDWPAVFHRLATMFPRAFLGFGECGTKFADKKESYLARYYQTKIPEGRFVGGFFWWYFGKDMVPRSKPLWETLHRLTAERRVPGSATDQ